LACQCGSNGSRSQHHPALCAPNRRGPASPAAQPGSRRRCSAGRSGTDGERYAFTPSLGLFHATTASNGDLVVPENRLRQLLASGDDVRAGIDRLLGAPWDAELETFRHAGDGAPVRWLHQVV
jgi:hypothetical protein